MCPIPTETDTDTTTAGSRSSREPVPPGIFIVQELCAGNLRGFLVDRPPLQGSEGGGSYADWLSAAHRVAAEVAAGMAYLHSRGIVHRDLKPENVMLTADGTARIGDFGLSSQRRLSTGGMLSAAAGTLECVSA